MNWKINIPRLALGAAALSAVLVLAASKVSAQNFPFPQHVSYAAGIKPSSVSQAAMDNTVSNFWYSWKGRYLHTSTGGSYYVYYNYESPSATEASVSEGHGYGMVLAAYMAGADPSAKTYFDGLYKFYTNHQSTTTPYLMAWQQDKNGNNINGADSATDGDMDIAYGLLLADKQWGSSGSINYLKAATNCINAIMSGDVNQSKWTLRLGDWATSGTSQGFDSATATRPSDFMFDHMWSYYEATHDGRWTNVISHTYAVVNQIFANNSGSTGLIPDFVVLNGSTYQPAPANFLEGSDDGKYSYNSCRTPWRFATEYMVRGSSGIMGDIRKLNGWIKGKTGSDPDNIFPGYSLTGTALDSSYTDSSFTTPFGVCAMTDSTNQSWLNSEWSWNASRGINADDAYFGNSIKLQSMIVMSGNWWKPVYSGGTPNFSISASPSSRTIAPGNGTTFTAALTAVNGFSGTVSLSVTGLPAGAAGSFSPATVTGSGNSTLTVSTSGTTPGGTYTVTVTGTGGSLVHSDTVTLAVSDFTISATPSAQTVTAGDSAAYTVNAGNINAFSGTVSFSSSGVPAGAAGSFSPASATAPGSATFTVATTTNVTPGTYTLTTTGTSGSLSHDDTVTLTVNAPTAGEANLALGKTATASSIWNTNYTAALAVDGSDATRWSAASGQTNNQWVLIDLGAGAVYNRVVLKEISFARVTAFTLQSSGNGTTFTNLATGTTIGASHTVTFANAAARYVRLLMPTASGVPTLNEIQVYQDAAPAQNLYESETLAYTTNGAAVVLQVDAAASGGEWISFNADAANDYIEFTVPGVPAGTYDLNLLYKEHPNRGIISVSVDGVTVGGNLDEYSATPDYTANDFGNVTFTGTGSHVVRLTAVGKNASSGAFTVSADAFQLTPASPGWRDKDIGAVGLAGSFSQSGGTLTVAGSGADIWTTADQFHYAYQDVSGDVTVVARVASEQDTAAYAKAGVMLRASVATNAVFASVTLTPTNGVAFICRTGAGVSAVNTSGWVHGLTAPAWVKVTRSGSTFTGYSSPDGTSWTQVGSTNLTMSAGITAGLCVTAHDNTKLNTATFDNVTAQ